MIKITHISYSFGKGGASKAASNIINCLARKNFDIKKYSITNLWKNSKINFMKFLLINLFFRLIIRKKKNSFNLFDLYHKDTNIKNSDILDFLSKNNRIRPKIVAGFSAETKNVIRNSILKMKNKNCDLIFANDVSKKEIGFNSDFNKVSVLDQRGNIKIIVLIEEVMNFKIHEKVKIEFDKNKFYVFSDDGNLIFSPYGDNNGKN